MSDMSWFPSYSQTMNAPLRFTFNETKCIEALTFLASQWEGVTKFYAAKVLFYAEKLHLNRYGRPIVVITFYDFFVLARIFHRDA